MKRLELVDAIAMEIMGWSSGLSDDHSPAWFFEHPCEIFLRSTKECQGNYPEYFRPDQHYIHKMLMIEALCDAKNASYKYIPKLKGKKFGIVIRNQLFVTRYEQDWESGRPNILACEAALDFWRAHG